MHHHSFKRECLDEFIHCEKLAVIARIPSEHRQHIDESLREISVLTVAARNFALGIDPPEREYRETEPVSVPLAEFALAVRFEQKRKVCETRHGVLPSERLVKQVVKRK